MDPVFWRQTPARFLRPAECEARASSGQASSNSVFRRSAAGTCLNLMAIWVFLRAIRFPGPHVEGNSRPSPVVDQDLQSDICFGTESGATSGSSRYPEPSRWPSMPASVYWPRTALHSFREVTEPHCFDHLRLFRADSVGAERIRRFHCGHRHKLKYVVRHHVAERAGFLVELSRAFPRQPSPPP